LLGGFVMSTWTLLFNIPFSPTLLIIEIFSFFLYMNVSLLWNIQFWAKSIHIYFK
jgi:membrane protein CcdC involved in cytochrome C biogenesis